MRPRRKALAVLCVALVIFAAFGPALAGPHALAFLVPLWYEFQPDLAVVVCPDAGQFDEQPQPLLFVAASRAPPHA
jgi:hypothetical protein